MRYLKLFENFIDGNTLDYDLIMSELKSMGWGDLSSERFNDFEESIYYSGTTDSMKYADEMNDYMYDISNGEIENDALEINEKKEISSI